MEIINENGNTPRRLKGLGFGILLIAIGAILFGINFGYIDGAFKRVIFSWPSILIVIGVYHLFKKQQLFWGLLWIAAGLFFMMPRLVRAFPDSFPEGLAQNFSLAYWPLLIILVGIVVILNKVFFPVNEWKSKINAKIHDGHSKWYKSSGGFEKNSIFGGGEHIILDPVFTGGEINSVFGGMTLDLRRTTLAEGETVLDMNAVFGGVTLYIPGNWYVVTKVDAVFGGFEDKRLIQEPIDKSRKLIIVGACVFGGGEIQG
jgi:predicted membrane protein